MIYWHSGRVVSGSHPRFCLPPPALSLRVIRASRLHSYAALFNSALGSPESPGSGAGFQPGLLLVPGPVGHSILEPLLTTGCSPSGLILYLGVLWASGIRCGTSVLRVSISLPPLATQCLYGKYHGQKTSPGQAKSFLMISWQSGRVVSGSHPRFCLPLPALSLRIIRASRLHSYAALFNSVQFWGPF